MTATRIDRLLSFNLGLSQHVQADRFDHDDLATRGFVLQRHQTPSHAPGQDGGDPPDFEERVEGCKPPEMVSKWERLSRFEPEDAAADHLV
jgi:hypothetical protein